MKVMLDAGAFAPTRSHRTDAGLDIKSPVTTKVPAHGSTVIDTGVHVELPHGTAGMIKSRSGLNTWFGIVSEGVVDVGYTGSIKVKIYNHSDKYYLIQRGDKLAQLVIVECIFPDVEIVDSLEDTERGDNGFGSSGR